MFPQGVSTPLRIYFFRGDNDRILVIAGLRTSTQDTSEEEKGGLVVRELRPDHTLGEIYILQVPKGPRPANLPVTDRDCCSASSPFQVLSPAGMD